MPRLVAITRTPGSISWKRSRSPVTTITSMPCSCAAAGERGDHVVGLVARNLQVLVAEGLDQRVQVRPLLRQQVGALPAAGLVLLVDLLAPGHARVPDHERGLDAVLGEDLHEHRGEAEDRVRREALRGGDRLGQGEEGAEDEAVPVDQEELAGTFVGHGSTLAAWGARIIGLLPAPSAQFSLTLRVELPHRPGGVLGKVTAAITRAGGAIVAVDTVEAERRAARCARSPIECSGVGAPRPGDLGRPGGRAARGGGDHRPHLRGAPARQDPHRPEHAGEVPRRPLDGLHARASRGCAPRSPRTARRRSSTRSRRTPSPSSPTAPRCSASATSAPRRRCP